MHPGAERPVAEHPATEPTVAEHSVAEHSVAEQGVERQLVRFLTILAVVLLTALNAADYVTTRMLLARSGSEANPLAGALLGDGRLLWVKMGLLALFGIMVLGLRARLGILALAWFAAGLYATAVLSNVLLLRLT